MLGQIDGFYAMGELRSIWEYGFIKNGLCGCRVPFRECEFWRAVVREAFGDINHVDAKKMWCLTDSFRIYHLPLMLIPHITKRLAFRLNEYLENLEKLYRAIHATTGSRVIVDSSKLAQYAYILQMIPVIELAVVHLVRDPRAVAYSWSRKKLLQPNTKSPEYMVRLNPVRSSLIWSTRNIGAMYLHQASVRYIMCRYEDFIGKPQEFLKRILNLLGETDVELPFVAEDTVEINKSNHSVFGNLVRFRTGTVELRVDNAWETKMKRLHKIVVTTLTWPLLFKYRYPISSQNQNRHPATG